MTVHLDLAPVPPAEATLEPAQLSTSLEARGLRRILVASAPDDLVTCLPLNGFVMALHLAYTQHRPLTIGPDDVWNVIAQGLARHVAENAEELRPRLVRHTGKLPLEVRRDELLLEPESETHWGAAVDDLAAEVKKHLGGRADLFVARFSTTDARSRIASSIALLGAMQSYFEYVVVSLCGIPRITLLGTPEDWSDIRARTRVLAELGLEWWARELDPVLEEIEATSRGKKDATFWERIYKVHHASGGEAISGWVNALFPYVDDFGDKRNPWFEVKDEGNELELPKVKHYPGGLTSAPFTWRRMQEELPMSLVAGFFGVRRAEDGGVQPAIGWAVTHANPPRRFRAIPWAGGVVQLSPRVAITSFEGIADEIALDGHVRVEVSVMFSPTLASFTGLAEASAVESVAILSCNAVTSLEPLPSATSLRRVAIQQCEGITDLEPLASMSLDTLTVSHNPNVHDYSPLARVRGLTQLDLFGNTVPEHLRGRHTGADAIAAVQRALAGNA